MHRVVQANLIELFVRVDFAHRKFVRLRDSEDPWMQVGNVCSTAASSSGVAL